jgi:hypothetical protein
MRPRVVNAGPEHDRRPEQREDDAWMLGSELLDDVLDLELVRRIGKVEVGAQRRLFRQRYVVVRVRSIDRGRG